MVSYTTKRLLESITARDPASGEARHRRAMPCCYPTALSESHLQRLRHLGIEYTEQWGSHRDRHVRRRHWKVCKGDRRCGSRKWPGCGCYRRRGGHLDNLEHRHAEKRRACLATATGTDRSTYDHACKPGVHGRVTQAGECSGYVQKPVTRRRLKFYVEEKQRLACSSTLDFTVGFHSRHASIRAEAGVRKRFCQAVIQQAIFAGMTYHRSAVREGLLF
jgi:hypothetical protein